MTVWAETSMNLWFRVIYFFIAGLLRAKNLKHDDVSRLKFRVWPHDLDTNLHLNNGRYLTMADLGRMDLLLRAGLLRAVLKEGLLPMLSGTVIRYRREIRPFQRFELQSRIVCWRATAFVMEHRYIIEKDGEAVTAALALVRGGLYDKKSRRFVPAAHLMELAGYTGPSPEITPEIEAFLSVEDSLKSR
jgi:acyl-CoA thioesterase FadM